MYSKIAIFITLFLFLTGCSQEDLIFLKNLRNVKFISFNEILDESGLLSKKTRNENIAGEVNNEITAETNLRSAIPSYNKELIIPENKDFSINMKVSSNFIVLKSIQGDVLYQKEKSSQEKGIFLFHSGVRDSKIRLQEFDQGGTLVRNLYYYVRIKPAVKEETQKMARASSSSAGLSIQATNISSESNAVIAPSTDMSSIIIASIQGLSPNEALAELDKMISLTNIQDNERELIRYKKIDILISQDRFNEASEELKNLRNQYKRSFYTGKLLMERKNYKEALRNYMDALGGDDDTKKKAILDIEKLILDMRAAEKNLIDRLKAETNRFKSDKDFYVNSMLGIARIYQYLPDVYSARDIYEMILNGDYSDSLKEKVRHSYDELKKDFLEYR